MIIGLIFSIDNNMKPFKKPVYFSLAKPTQFYLVDKRVCHI